MKFAARIVLLSFATAAVAASQRSEAPELRVSDVEHGIFQAVNHERTNAKLTSLLWDDRLTRIARAHSEDMVRRRFFDHINPDGDDPSARGHLAGYDCRRMIGAGSYREGLAENLFDEPRFSRVRISGTRRSYDWNSPSVIVRDAIEGWMHSPGHRRNILDTSPVSSGVGIAVSADHVYITQLFC